MTKDVIIDSIALYNGPHVVPNSPDSFVINLHGDGQAQPIVLSVDNIDNLVVGEKYTLSLEKAKK